MSGLNATQCCLQGSVGKHEVSARKAVTSELNRTRGGDGWGSKGSVP